MKNSIVFTLPPQKSTIIPKITENKSEIAKVNQK